jgi:hypothetical protein
MSRAALSLAAVFVFSLAAACQGRPAASSSCLPTGAPTGAPGGCDPTRTPADASSPLGPPPSATPDENAPADIDATLLDYLPETVGDIAVAENLEEAAIAVSDPSLSRIATAVDVGVALDATTGNLVTVHVVRLREGAFDDAIYRQWRDTFDAGACAAADGVNARAEMTIDARTVFVTSCVAGLRTYHVWIEAEDLLISASSIGSGRFGEQLVHELRVP